MRLGLVVAVVVFLTYTSIAQAREAAKDTAQEASAFYNLKRLDKAIEKYDIALSDASDPRLISTIYFNKGVALYKMKEYSKAIDAFTKALATDKKRLEAKASYNLGNAKYRLCEYFVETNIGKAIELCSQALDYYQFSIESGTRLSNAVYNYEYVRKQLDYFLIKKDLEEKKKESQRYPRNSKIAKEGPPQGQRSQGTSHKEQEREQQQDKKQQGSQDSDRGRNVRGSAESSANGQDDLNNDMQKQSKQLEDEFDKRKERLKQETQGEDLKNKLNQLDKQKAQAQKDLNKERFKKQQGLDKQQQDQGQKSQGTSHKEQEREQQQDKKQQESQDNDQGGNVRGSAESFANGQDSLSKEDLKRDKIQENKKSLDRDGSIDYTKSEYDQVESKQASKAGLSREEANRLLDAYNRNEKGLLRDNKKASKVKSYSYNDW